MKVTIQQVNRFSVTIGDKTYNDFEKCEEWEGMIKFSGPSGAIVVDKESDRFTSIFKDIFHPDHETDKFSFNLIKASNGLV